VLEKLSATVLEIAKEHQNGRAEKKSAMADFTEQGKYKSQRVKRNILYTYSPI